MMMKFNGIWLRLSAIFQKEHNEREMDAELRFHLEMQIEENIRRGMSPAEARYAAQRTFGGVDQVKEDCRETRGIRWLNELFQDLRFGVRILRRNPGITGIAILTLALGIGATTAIFTVVNAVLLRPLPYPEPGHLVYVKGDTWGPFTSGREYTAWQNRSQTLSQIAAYMDRDANFIGSDQSERVSCATVTASFFPLLGIRPIVGRNFALEEDRPGGPQAVILSQARWKRDYGGDPSVLGKTLTLDGKIYTIIGVVPERFQVSDRYRFNYDFWLPLALDVKEVSLVRVVGRLRPGVGVEQARSELDTVLQSTLRKGQKRHAVVTSWQDEVGGDVRLSLLIFLGAVACVLMIACANVANLALARAAVREREFVVRRALGVGQLRILRQLLTESVLMALLGGMLGLALAFWGRDLLVAFLTTSLPMLDPIDIDYRVLGFNFSLSLLTGAAFGLAPAMHASKTPLNESLKDGSRGATEGKAHRRLRSLLAVSELALAMVLLVGAGLLLRSFLRLREIDPGIKTDHVLSVTIDLTPSQYPTTRAQAAFFQQVLERTKALAGIHSAAVSSDLGLGGYRFTVSGGTIEGSQETLQVDIATISQDYFRVLGIPLTKGRAFEESDREGAPGVVVANEAFVRRYFPSGDCLGKRISVEKNEWMSIVGVVPDVHGFTYDPDKVPVLYRPNMQDGRSHMQLVVRTAGDPLQSAAAVEAQIRSIDRGQPPHNITTLDQEASDFLAPQRIDMWLLTAFAGMALILAAIGIYGVISYSVSRRTHEIGIRTAMGARPSDVLRLVLGHGMLLVAIGLGIGMAVSLALGGIITSMLYKVSNTDPYTYAGTALLLALVALLACYIPARRAARVDPMVALRNE